MRQSSSSYKYRPLYKTGTALSIETANGNFLGAFVAGRFENFYHLCLLASERPQLMRENDFTTGKFFGSIEETPYHECTFEVLLLDCEYTDKNPRIKNVAQLPLLSSYVKDVYHRLQNVDHLFSWYSEKAAGMELAALPELHFALSDMDQLLQTALFSGNLEKAKELLGTGADINKETASGSYPAFSALASDAPAALEFALQQGANPQQSLHGDWTLLHEAFDLAIDGMIQQGRNEPDEESLQKIKSCSRMARI